MIFIHEDNIYDIYLKMIFVSCLATRKMATPMISAKELNQLREIRAFHEYSKGLTDN